MEPQNFTPSDALMKELFIQGGVPGLELSGEWFWSPTFKESVIPSDARSFTLDQELDLDTLYGRKCPADSEIALYKKFTSDREALGQLGISCDWFFQAYCNGQLCFSTWERGNEESRFLPEDHPFLIPVKKGENLLAVRVRRGNMSWSFCCSGTLKGFFCCRPQLMTQPVLGHPSNTAVSFSFYTCGEVGCGIDYRVRGSEQWLRQWDCARGRILRRAFHKVALHDLDSGKEYEYRVVMIDPADPVQFEYSQSYTFRTPQKDQKKFSFFYTADLQFPAAEQRRLLSGLMAGCDAKSCDFLVLGGDIGSSFNSQSLIGDLFPLIQKEAGSDKPVIYIRGNHELRGTESDHFNAFFGNPGDDSTYWLFCYGDTAFLVLDCWEDKVSDYPGHLYCKYNLDREFLEAESRFAHQAMATEAWRSAKRRIVLCHGAPFSHYADWPLICDGLKQMTDAELKGKNPETPLNLWLAGHTHDYSRSVPGSAEYTAREPLKKPYYEGQDYYYPVLTVAGPGAKRSLPASAFRVDACEDGSLTVAAYDPDGKCFEKIRISKENEITELISLPHYHTYQKVDKAAPKA